MNKIATLLIAMMVISCQEEETLESKTPENYISAKRNTLDWTGITEISLNEATDTLTLLGITNRPDDEVLVIRIKLNGTGTYSLTNNQGYYYSTVGGDVITSEYRIAPNNTGTMVISKYDQEEKWIEGSFVMSLTQERSNPENDIEIYEFTQGSFRGEIIN